MSKKPGRRWRWVVVSGAVALGLVLAAWLVLWRLTPPPVSGQLVEYHSAAPVAGATVTLSRHGWGLSGPDRQLVWDKRYVASATTDADGHFRVPMPGPAWLLASGSGQLQVEAEGFHSLDAGYVPPGAELRLQTVANRDERLPGGTAYLGWDEAGDPFGWSFIDHAPVRDTARADLYPVAMRREPFAVTLAVAEGGGMSFVSAEAQGIAHDSWDSLLRYLDASPEPTVAGRLTLDATPGTLFLRTAQDRHAKLAWEPGAVTAMSGFVPGLDASSERLLSLRFVYRPEPGRDLPFQPPLHPVEPVRAALLATLPGEGEPHMGPRAYWLTVTDAEGRVLERQRVELEPGSPLDLSSCAVDAPLTWRFASLRLAYDEQSLPRVALTLDGRTFVHHSGARLVGPRDDTVFAVMAFDTDYRRHDLEVRLRELPAGASPVGCLPSS
ncbi:hypothetical protein [Halomonas sp. CKK8]|uniref:hypothetical protein n=1 Tax=Halomonas sp. CKK8 TaxID=3036127 RepID=UPI0024155EF1|nr:hypothetical protein [Halomonas sp. CKK8]WFM72744.1 hypothetical protein P8934_07065 [Halomonas sp. CKK8]